MEQDTTTRELLARRSRRGFLRVAGLASIGGTAALLSACGDDEEAGGGGEAAQTPQTTQTQQGQTGDMAILALAAKAEQVAISFYDQLLESDLAREGAIDRNYLTEARKNEQTHFDQLADVLGGDAPRDLQVTFPDNAFSSLKSAAKLGSDLETAFIGAYLGAVPALESKDLKAVAGRIASNEAQHLSVFTDFLDDEPISLEALPKMLSADEATSALQPFLGGGGS